MKTRTLLLLAVGCGLIILVAGSIKVFLIADDSTPAHLSIGTTAKVGDMTVTVQSVRPVGDQILVDVQLIGVDDDDGATSFFYGIGQKQELRPVAPATGVACGATRATTVTDCVLAFDTATSSGVLRYVRSGSAPVRWDIVGTPTG